MKTILITGGAGFIGSHLTNHFVNKYRDYNFIILDKLTYAGDLSNIKHLLDSERVHFFEGDICDLSIFLIFKKYNITDVIHCAAESHVDRSIHNPLEFVKTNVLGTVNLLNICKEFWGEETNHLFYHISTDEVYGSLGLTGKFTEETPYDPRSPYSASKASSDHFVKAYHETYKLPIVISNCSNNYGTHQYPEKLIPVVINKILNGEKIPVYGNGDNIRDWLHVQDHVEAIDLIFHKGKIGETYNIGGDNEWTNIDLIKLLCKLIDSSGNSEKLISFVEDRKGHDLRYSIDATKIKNELGWEPKKTFDNSLQEIIEWYKNKFKYGK